MPRTRQLLIGLVLLVLCVTPNTASAVDDSGAGAVDGAPGPVRVAKQLDAQGRVPADFAVSRPGVCQHRACAAAPPARQRFRGGRDEKVAAEQHIGGNDARRVQRRSVGRHAHMRPHRAALFGHARLGAVPYTTSTLPTSGPV